MDKNLDKLPTGAFQTMASNWSHSVSEIVKFYFEWTIHQSELSNSKQSTTFKAGWDNTAGTRCHIERHRS